MISKFVRMLLGNRSNSPTATDMITVRSHSETDPNDTSTFYNEEKIKACAYEQARAYVLEHLAATVPMDYHPGELAFVDPWAYDLYEILTLPQHRFMDVKVRQEGYVNLIYKDKPITKKSKHGND